MIKKQINLSQATGRRKTAVARIYVRQGTGKIKVNDRDLVDYFPVSFQQQIVKSPIEACNIQETDFIARVFGGGLDGQAVAVRHAISRALVKIDGERRKILKEKGFLTRDPRKRERKKYGQPGARKKFQFSKR